MKCFSPLRTVSSLLKKRKFGYIVRETSVFERAKNAFSDRNESENFKGDKLASMRTHYEIKKNGMSHGKRCYCKKLLLMLWLLLSLLLLLVFFFFFF